MTNVVGRDKSFLLSNQKILHYCIIKFRMNALHYALLAIVILLIVYYGTNLLREGNYDCKQYCDKINKPAPTKLRQQLLNCSGGRTNYYDYWRKTCPKQTKE